MTPTTTRARRAASRRSQARWLGAYLFTRTFNSELIDDVILDVIAPILADPIVKKATIRSFFVRFRDVGPHVRLRIKVPELTLEHVRERVEHLVAEHLTAAHAGSPTEPLPDSATRSSNTSLVFQPYVPEELRYGGPHGLAIAEEFFQCSSRLSIDLLAALRQQRLDRSGVGLGVMLATMRGLSRGEREMAILASDYAHSFGRGWVERWYGNERAEEMVDRPVRELETAMAPQLRALRQAARHDQLPGMVQAYARAAATYRRKLVALIDARKFNGEDSSPIKTLRAGLHYVAPSLLHMTTNRLGIDNPLECRLTETLARSYRRDP